VVEVVLVDFDDTLVNTSPRFQNARRELFRLLSSAGFAEADAQRVHHDEIDPLMREQYGLGPARLEHSFQATYEALCTRGGIAVDDVICERARSFGRAVAGPPPLFNGALAALERLASALPTVLYTQSGDRSYQLGCVTACGLLDVIPVERVIVCDRKTTDQFRLTIEQLGVTDPATAWMIGNSMRSDINPALEAGANAILVEAEDPWEFDMVEPVSDGYHRVGSFPEAVDFLLGVQR
jgi:putative hydrolase of the HAD superfamily